MPQTTSAWQDLLLPLSFSEALPGFLRGLGVLLVGLLFARLIAMGLDRSLASRLSLQHRMIARRATFYALAGLVVATALRQMGVDLTVLLGAAGVLSVAVGFASQTSASNLISGLFLLTEQPFVIGDIISVGPVTGEVVSIDMLSVKLRTFSNVLVRVPNEQLLKTEISNLTHFPIRRFELMLRVSYREDVERINALLTEVADANPLCLDEPRPALHISAYGEHGVELQFNVWSATENFWDLRYTIQRDVRERLSKEGIDIPMAQRSMRGPVEVRVVGSGGDTAQGAG